MTLAWEHAGTLKVAGSTTAQAGDTAPTFTIDARKQKRILYEVTLVIECLELILGCPFTDIARIPRMNTNITTGESRRGLKIR